MKNNLSGIERELVVRYLCDGNVPITVIALPFGEDPAPTELFSIDVSADEMTILDRGIILLKNPGDEAKIFIGRPVRTQFFFNKLELFFDTEIKLLSSGALALAVPEKIQRVKRNENNDFLPFKVVIFAPLLQNFEKNQKNVDFPLECFSRMGYTVSLQPKWSDIPEEKSLLAKNLLEKIVFENRAQNSTVKNGVHLISICRFLTEDFSPFIDYEKKISVIFVDYERIVFASEKTAFENIFGKNQNVEWAIQIFFPILPQGPIKFREIFVTCTFEKSYSQNEKICASFIFTSIKTEDMRFLYEKTKNELLK